MKKQKEAETAQIIELHKEGNTQYLKQVYNIGIYSYLRCEHSNGSHPTPPHPQMISFQQRSSMQKLIWSIL